ILGLFFFKKSDLEKKFCPEQNTIVSIFIATVSVFLGILMSFTISTVSSDYSETSDQIKVESKVIYLLFSLIHTIPNTSEIQKLIIEYIRFIIHHEFPSNNSG